MEEENNNGIGGGKAPDVTPTATAIVTPTGEAVPLPEPSTSTENDKNGQLSQNRGKNLKVVLIIVAVLFIIPAITIGVLVLSATPKLQSSALDNERKTDILAISAQAESYHDEYGAYPLKEQMSSTAWMEENFIDIDSEHLVDPDGNLYSYEGTTCGAVVSYIDSSEIVNGCASNTLSTELSDGTYFTFDSIY